MNRLVVLQMSEKMLKLTPVTKKGVRYNYGLPVAFELPEVLLGGDFAKNIFNFAEFSAECIKKMKLSKAGIVICMDDGSIVSKKFEHFPVKREVLLSNARLEAESVLQGGSQEYYISALTSSTEPSEDGKLKSMLYAVSAELIRNIYKQFKRRGLNVIRIAPSISGLAIATKQLLGKNEADQNQEKVTAVIDLGFEKVGLVMYKNGAIVFERSFESVYDDIIKLVCEARGITYEAATRQLRRDGISQVGGGHELIQEQVNLLMESSYSEVIRNMRVVLSSERLELDKIIFCGAFTSIANFKGFIESLGLDIPNVMLDELDGFEKYNITLLETAKGTGFQAGDFFSTSGLIAHKKGDGVNFLDELKLENSNKKASTAVMSILTVLSLCAMVVQPLIYYNASVTLKEDKAFLTSQVFDDAKALKQRQLDTNQKYSEIQKDAEGLPFGKSKTSKAVAQAYSQIIRKAQSVLSYSIDNREGLLNISFVTKSLDDYLAIRDSVIADGYFTVAVPFTATANGDDESYSCNVTLRVSDFESYPATEEPIAESEVPAE